MSFLSTILNFFGTKSDRDMKELAPSVNEILAFSSSFSNFSNDELRQKTFDFKSQIKLIVEDYDKEIHQLKEKSIAEKNRDNKEDIYKKIDELETKKSAQINEKLDEIKAEAFALIKETATRFNNHDSIEVTSNEFDVLLSEKVDYVNIKDDVSIWNTSWISGGVMKKWDMIHYNVQLIGGLVLHGGNIAEMQTGEGKTLVSTLPIYLNALTGLGVHVVTVNNYLAKRDAE